MFFDLVQISLCVISLSLLSLALPLSHFPLGFLSSVLRARSRVLVLPRGLTCVSIVGGCGLGWIWGLGWGCGVAEL